MARPPRDVTDAELAVLQVLWDDGPATIRKLTETLYPDGSASHYATVQKLLERLEAKGFVQRDRGPGAHEFRPRIDRQDLIGRRLEDMADKLCEGSFTPLLTHLLSGRRLTAAERKALRDLVDELDRGGRRKRKKR